MLLQDIKAVLGGRCLTCDASIDDLRPLVMKAKADLIAASKPENKNAPGGEAKRLKAAKVFEDLMEQASKALRATGDSEQILEEEEIKIVLRGPEGDNKETFGLDGDGSFKGVSINVSKEFKTKDGGPGSGVKGHVTNRQETKIQKGFIETLKKK